MSDINKLSLFPIDIEYSEEGSDFLTKIYCVTADRQNIILIDKKFKPYFYVITKPDNVEYIHKKLRSLEVKDEDKIIKVLNVKKVKKILKKNAVTILKVTVTKPTDVVALRKVINSWEDCEPREADIPFVHRYLIDNKITLLHQHTASVRYIKNVNKTAMFELENISSASTEHLHPKVLALDIETNSNIQPDLKNDAIISISFYGPGFRKVVTWKTYPDAPDYVHFVSGEIDLLEETKKVIETYSPQVIVGYNSSGFDFPIILERLNKYKIENNFGWDNSKLLVEQKRNGADARMAGYLMIDCFPFMKNILSADLKTNRLSLDSVANELLGYGKTEDFGSKIYHVWQNSNADELRKLSEYNLRDSEITYKLFYKIFETLLEFTKLTGIHTRNLSTMYYSQLVEWYLIFNSIRENKLVPNRPSYKQIAERHRDSYAGAFVVQPTPGLYSNIALFDFRSLYPSIIVAHNIDPQNLNCKCCKLGSHKIRIDTIDYRFCKKTIGFVPQLIKDLIERRTRVKDIMKRTNKDSESYQELKARQFALKIIANAFYGYLGFPAGRWYSIECARSITGWGRKYIHEVIKKAEVNKMKVIYGDTDSVFLALKDETLHGVKKFLEQINKNLPNPIELEYEGFYPTGIFLGKKDEASGAKKRYALLSDSGEMIIKGLESVRGDWSKIAREAQTTVLEAVLKNRNAIEAEKYIVSLIGDIKQRKIDLNKLIIRTRITKALSTYKNKGPHVVAAELAVSRGKKVLPGMFISYIIGKGSGALSSRAMLLEDANIDSYDVSYYTDQQVIRAVYKIFELFDISEEQLKGGQTTLGGWG
jgi:DNA polymerase, archaea type